MKIRCRISHESAAKSRTHIFDSQSTAHSMDHTSVYLARSHKSLAQNIPVFQLSDTSVLEISAYLQKVILVLHLYIKSLARILSVSRIITKWVCCHNSFERLRKNSDDNKPSPFSVVWAQFNSLQYSKEQVQRTETWLLTRKIFWSLRCF